MRHHVRAFVAAAAEALALRGPVYEFGSYQVAGQDGQGDLRGLFPGTPYIGCDMRPGPGVDRIEDLAGLSLPDEAAQTIVCVDTLEHVLEPCRAMSEVIRVMRPGGVLLVAAPLDFHIHAHPDDYWRLTPSCLARLLSPLAVSLVGSQGVESYPHTVYGIGWKPPVSLGVADAARRFIAGLEARLADLAASVPSFRRLTSRVRACVCTKGERRRRREFYRTRFALHATAASSMASDVRSAADVLSRTATSKTS
jgi:SAM-dependent methyltransferase